MTLREKEQSEEEIAAPQVVRQRLKLAAVAPALLKVFAEDDMTLEQIMAFVRATADKAPGATILCDLFKSDCGGWFQNVALLDRPVSENLTASAEVVEEEGWTWIEVAVDLPHGFSMGLRKLAGTSRPISAEESAMLAELREEIHRWKPSTQRPRRITMRSTNGWAISKMPSRRWSKG